jgi:hypothetical protein
VAAALTDTRLSDHGQKLDAVLEDLLAADAGYAGPRLDCGAGHQARLAGYRDKAAGTVLGPVTLRRVWYHCGKCGHGLAPVTPSWGWPGRACHPGRGR